MQGFQIDICMTFDKKMNHLSIYTNVSSNLLKFPYETKSYMANWAVRCRKIVNCNQFILGP